MMRNVMNDRRLFSALAVFFVATAAFVVYSNIFGYPFVFDDIPHILENTRIRSILNYFSPGQILMSREMVNFTFAVNYALGDYEVFGYHFVNVLIHVLNGVVVYFLSLLLQRGMFRGAGGAADGGDGSFRLVSLFTALLFVVHPLQTQAVTYTIQRYTSMAALFYMASVLFYLKARFLQIGEPAIIDAGNTVPGKGVVETDGRKKKPKNRKPFPAQRRMALKPDVEKSTATVTPSRRTAVFRTALFFVLSVLCALVALRSKENTLSLPAAVLLAEYFAVDRSWQGWKRKIPWITGAFAAGAFFYLYASGLLRSGFSLDRLLSEIDRFSRETNQVGRLEYLFTQFNVLIVYLRLLVFPTNQNLDYMYPFSKGFFEGTTPYAFTFLLVLAVFALLVRKRWPVCSFGILWFFITLSVESGIIPIKDALFEHRLYLPMLSYSFVVSWLILHVLQRFRLGSIVFLTFLVVLYGSAAHMRNTLWHDEWTLWTDVVKKNPYSVRGLNSLGTMCKERNEVARSLEYFTRALEVSPTGGDPTTFYNMANALQKLGKLEEAITFYKKVIERESNSPEAYNNLGIVYQMKGDLEAAMDSYRMAVKLKPSNRRAQNNLASVLLKSGNYEAAVNHFKQIIQYYPDDYHTYSNIAAAYEEMGNFEESLSFLRKAVKINPRYVGGLFNLGMLLEKHGALNESIDYYVRAVEMDPSLLVPAGYRIARIYSEQGEEGKSLVWLDKIMSKGFKDIEAIQKNESFKHVRGRTGYRELLQKHGLADH